jgi:hypothetical protein
MFGVVFWGGPSLQIQPLICAPPLTIVGPVDVLISGGDGLCISAAVFRFEPDFVIGVAEGVIVCIFPPFYRYHPIFLSGIICAFPLGGPGLPNGHDTDFGVVQVQLFIAAVQNVCFVGGSLVLSEVVGIVGDHVGV